MSYNPRELSVYVVKYYRGNDGRYHKTDSIQYDIGADNGKLILFDRLRINAPIVSKSHLYDDNLTTLRLENIMKEFRDKDEKILELRVRVISSSQCIYRFEKPIPENPVIVTSGLKLYDPVGNECVFMLVDGYYRLMHLNSHCLYVDKKFNAFEELTKDFMKIHAISVQK